MLGDEAAAVILQETEAGIAMGGVQHYYCTLQRRHSQKHNLSPWKVGDPLRGRAGRRPLARWGLTAV